MGRFVLWLGLNRRRMSVHRRLGIGYITSVGLSSIGALYLAFHTDLGWVYAMGLVGLATAWLVTTGLALASIRRRLIEQHKEWMIRSYVVTFGFVNFRILAGVLQIAGIGTLIEQLDAASWFCWSIPPTDNRSGSTRWKNLFHPRRSLTTTDVSGELKIQTPLVR